jgi:hypothetical protein
MSQESVNLNCGRHCMVESSDMHFLATILEPEFNDYRLCMAELKGRPSYDDFVMERDGYFMGLSWAGENVVQVEVPHRFFMRWVDLTGSPCSLESLDDFAMRRWLRARYPEWNVRLRSKVTPRVADQSGLLYIPVCLTAVEAWQRHLFPIQSDGAFNSVLAGFIAEECLDPAE